MCYITLFHHQQIDGFPSIDPKYKIALQVQNKVAVNLILNITINQSFYCVQLFHLEGSEHFLYIWEQKQQTNVCVYLFINVFCKIYSGHKLLQQFYPDAFSLK